MPQCHHNRHQLQIPFEDFCTEPANVVLQQLQHTVSTQDDYDELSDSAVPDYILHSTVQQRQIVAIIEFNTGKLNVYMATMYVCKV